MNVVFDENSALDPGKVVVDNLAGSMDDLLLEPNQEINEEGDNQNKEAPSPLQLQN